MCGVIGVIYKNGAQPTPGVAEGTLRLVRAMLDTLRLRGPDECHLAQMGPAFLGHTRLSIIDLSSGSQPIYNEDKTIAVVFNGEIYNYVELRDDLERKGHRFHTTSDTEVIVHLYEECGEEVFTHLNGMFAIVLYDARRHLLLAARDRLGEKPLLYQETSERLLLASELKALLQSPTVGRDLNPDALALYLNSMYVPAPHSIFQRVKKVPPAHYLKLADGRLSLQKYWDPQPRIRWGWSEDAIREELLALFADAVRIRTRADVPVGSFLSGGIDSSGVTAFMARCTSEPVRTFSVGFTDEIDERPYARMVAERYATRHTELFVNDRVEDVLESVVDYYDEPFADSSALPTYLIAREARKHIKVILTGDGGDELFAGYGSYLDQKYQAGGRVPTKAFKVLNRLALRQMQSGALEGFYARSHRRGALAHWQGVRTFTDDSLLQRMLGAGTLVTAEFFAQNRWLQLPDRDPLTEAFEHDLNFYLPDDLLKKVDMASMANSLECRAPFLDHRLVELALKIPPPLKVKYDRLKHILKQTLAEHLPDAILQRGKIGFGAPVESWLKGGLKELAQDNLARGCLIESVIARQEIQGLLDDFYRPSQPSADFRTPYRIWILLMLELWMRRYAAGSVSATRVA